jgi:1-acyl-sn-glycerol-3-phosphate acyltransferase
MHAESAALLTLALLAAAAAAVVLRQIAECGSLSLWFLTKLFRTFCALRLGQRIQGRSSLPVSGGALLVANHRSPLDPMALYSASLLKESGYCTRVLEFVTASEYCGHSGPMGWIMRTARCIPVARDGKDMASAKEALRRLQGGKIVGIFPEGGIHLGAGLGEFDVGVAWLALRGGAPVIPAIVRNTPYREPIMTSFLATQPVNVIFGPPIDLSRWAGLRPTQNLLREVTEHLRRVMLELQDRAPPLPVDWRIAEASRRGVERLDGDASSMRR